MASTTIFASANSGAILCQNATYATARSGGGTLSASPNTDARIGQRLATGVYYCWQYGLEFDLTALAGATISAATLSMYALAIDGTPGYVIEARAFDYGASYTTADFVAGASLAGLTSLANWTSAAPDTTYKAFTDVAMVPFLVPGSANRMIVAGANQRTNTAPTGSEYLTSYYDNVGGNRPKLDITYTPASGRRVAFVGGGFF